MLTNQNQESEAKKPETPETWVYRLAVLLVQAFKGIYVVKEKAADPLIEKSGKLATSLSRLFKSHGASPEAQEFAAELVAQAMLGNDGVDEVLRDAIKGDGVIIEKFSKIHRLAIEAVDAGQATKSLKTALDTLTKCKDAIRDIRGRMIRAIFEMRRAPSPEAADVLAVLKKDLKKLRKAEVKGHMALTKALLPGGIFVQFKDKVFIETSCDTEPEKLSAKFDQYIGALVAAKFLIKHPEVCARSYKTCVDLVDGHEDGDSAVEFVLDEQAYYTAWDANLTDEEKRRFNVLNNDWGGRVLPESEYDDKAEWDCFISHGEYGIKAIETAAGGQTRKPSHRSPTGVAFYGDEDISIVTQVETRSFQEPGKALECPLFKQAFKGQACPEGMVEVPNLMDDVRRCGNASRKVYASSRLSRKKVGEVVAKATAMSYFLLCGDAQHGEMAPVSENHCRNGELVKSPLYRWWLTEPSATRYALGYADKGEERKLRPVSVPRYVLYWTGKVWQKAIEDQNSVVPAARLDPVPSAEKFRAEYESWWREALRDHKSLREPTLKSLKTPRYMRIIRGTQDTYWEWDGHTYFLTLALQRWLKKDGSLSYTVWLLAEDVSRNYGSFTAVRLTGGKGSLVKDLESKAHKVFGDPKFPRLMPSVGWKLGDPASWNAEDSEKRWRHSAARVLWELRNKETYGKAIDWVKRYAHPKFKGDLKRILRFYGSRLNAVKAIARDYTYRVIKDT